MLLFIVYRRCSRPAARYKATGASVQNASLESLTSIDYGAKVLRQRRLPLFSQQHIWGVGQKSSA